MSSSDHRRQLSTGFNWLGGATVTAKVIDFAVTLAVLRLMDKVQVGHAAIIISIGMVVEALNGIGVGDALVQARTVERRQLDTLFWYVLGAAVLTAGCTLLAAPVVGALYSIGAALPLLCLIAVKQPLVAAAVIPLALMNRDLQYRRIAGINLAATLAAATTRLGLALAGAGAWALVAGYVASGAYLLVGALLARPFWPRLRLDWAAARPLLHFGRRVAAANFAEQLFRNIDFLLVGWFYGAVPLAVYRVAFDVAMEPTMAVGQLVTRVTLPVFARAESARRADIVAWSLSRITALVAPLMVGLMFAAGPLMGLIHDRQGHSYAAAAWPLRLLAAAALLRVASQLLPAVMLVSGRPGDAARLAMTTLAMLTAGIVAVGVTLPARSGIVATAAIWLGLYPLVLVWGLAYLRRHWGIGPRALGRVLAPSAIVVGALALCLLLAQPFIRHLVLPVQVAIVVAATIVAYAVQAAARSGRRPEPRQGPVSLDP